METDILEYLLTDSLHDKVMERVVFSGQPSGPVICICTCRYWDSTTKLIDRIDLVFSDVRVDGDLAEGFDIYHETIEQNGGRLIVTLTENSSGLATVLNCSQAVVRSPSQTCGLDAEK